MNMKVSPSPRAQFETSLGSFVVELNIQNAPETSKYFANLIYSGILTGSTIFRIVNDENAELRAETPINVIQLGRQKMGYGPGQKLVHESTNKTGLTHNKRSISAAREAVGENYESFFICVRDEPELDFGGKRHPDGQGFAVFGKVIEGFEVLNDISKKAEEREYLETEIEIISIVEI